jgi:CRP-like cAMP-binding protein
METLPRYLQYGEQSIYPSRTDLYQPGNPLEKAPIFYVIAGLVRIAYDFAGRRLPIYAAPDSLFGLVEPLADCRRLCHAQALEKTIVYKWTLESFYTASGVSWELALAAITGMTRELRILNAEFGERLGAMRS